MSDYVVVTSTSNTITVINQPSTLVIADSAMRGPTGATGPTGPTGATGATGAAGDRYKTNSNSTIAISSGNKTFFVDTNLAYTIGQHVTAANTFQKYVHGPVLSYNSANGMLVINSVEWDVPAGNNIFSNWEVNLAGIPGSDGANANVQVGNVVTGAEGSNVTIVNVGNSTNVILDFSIPRGNTGNSGGGGGANTGNVTFQNNIVIGTGDEYGSSGLYFADGPNQIANLKYIRLRGGEDPTHIHLDAANTEEYDFFFGDDNKFVKLEHGFSGNVVISPWNAGGKVWTFTTNGILEVPTTASGWGRVSGDNLVISGDKDAMYSAYVFLPNNSDANTQSAGIFNGSGNVEIGAGGIHYWNFDANGDLTVPNYINFEGNTFIGDEPGAGTPGFRIVAPLNYGVTIETDSDISGNNWTWNFANNGTLTVPGEIRGFTTYGGGGVPNGHAVDIVPADDASDKKFKFRIDQYGETFTRAFFEMPEAQNNKQVAIAFPHANSNVGYIFTQGADTYDDGLNNAFNIFYNAGDIKVTAMTPGTGVFNIWKFGSNGALTFPDNTVQTTAYTGTDIITVKKVYETTNALTSATGVVTHNCNNGHIFVHSSVSANFTANFTNTTIAPNTATSFTLVINQGGTAYVPTAVQVGGQAQTVNWQGGTQPGGNANKKDVVSFSVINNNGTWITLGQLTSFG